MGTELAATSAALLNSPPEAHKSLVALEAGQQLAPESEPASAETLCSFVSPAAEFALSLPSLSATAPATWPSVLLAVSRPADSLNSPPASSSGSFLPAFAAPPQPPDYA